MADAPLQIQTHHITHTILQSIVHFYDLNVFSEQMQIKNVIFFSFSDLFNIVLFAKYFEQIIRKNSWRFYLDGNHYVVK